MRSTSSACSAENSARHSVKKECRVPGKEISVPDSYRMNLPRQVYSMLFLWEEMRPAAFFQCPVMRKNRIEQAKPGWVPPALSGCFSVQKVGRQQNFCMDQRIRTDRSASASAAVAAAEEQEQDDPQAAIVAAVVEKTFAAAASAGRKQQEQNQASAVSAAKKIADPIVAFTTASTVCCC